jgi:pimeloyl-ACP methyl ester carboxylesterase
MKMVSDEPSTDNRSSLWPFLAGIMAGAAGTVLAQALLPRRGLDTRLLRARPDDPDIPTTVIVPGILGSELLRPDGTHVWLNFGNAVGSHDLTLPFTIPLCDGTDDLRPGGLLGVDTVLPRLFGFTEYSDLLELLDTAGFKRDQDPAAAGAAYRVFTYDWRRDLVESARRLADVLDGLAEDRKDPHARFNLVGHSMGGLVARYYLRYGRAEPGGPVTWAGAKRVRYLALVATPNGGSIPALDSILTGSRVGLSYTTLSASVVARCPSVYQLLPPPGAPALLDHQGEPLTADLHELSTWERYGWGPYAPARRRAGDVDERNGDLEAHLTFLGGALQRARAFHESLARTTETPCPTHVIALGGDCLPTLARAVVPERRGAPPRFDPWTRTETHGMFEAGDGRVTRVSVLASHLPSSDDTETGSGLPEIAHAFFGSADHHGIYSEPTFQSVLLRLLLRPVRRPRAVVSKAERSEGLGVA